MFTQFVSEHKNDLENIALAVRLLGMDAVLKAKSGHVGLPLGGAELGTFLYFAVMNHDAKQPHWIDRDRFVLSAGHGSMLQYALLHLARYDLTKEDLTQFRQLGSKTPGHPEFGHTAGIECTTGPLGQGISNAVGMTIAERMLAARFNDSHHSLIDHRTFVIAGDGCLMEGVSAEACSLAGHLKLNRLIVLYDANNITIDGTIDISFSENVGKRYEAYGWNILNADGNDFISLAQAMDKANHFSNMPNGETGPTLIICKGIPGKGSPKWEGKPKIHGNPMSAEDVIDAKKHLGVSNTEPFYIPHYCIESANKLANICAKKTRSWFETFNKVTSQWEKENPEKYNLWKNLFENNSLKGFQESTLNLAQGKMATRTASGKALCELAAENPALVGGSADLAGSNLTTLPNTTFINAKDFSGRNIHFGVREHGMAAICNGITLHGGLRAFCATFAVFSDYMRPAIRLAALMKIPTLFILTHDSYAVGEDGPTHQPIEHAAALRAIPDLNVYRPADIVETFVAWENAILSENKPTALLLTRQDLEDIDSHLPEQRNKDDIKEGIKKGAYLLKDFSNENQAHKIVLIAAGSEVIIALNTAKLLESKMSETASGEKVKLSVRVVSAQAPQVLVENPVTLNKLVPKEYPIYAIEAGSPQSWGEIVGRNGAIFSMKTFGSSAPASVLAKHFGFTPEAFCSFVLNQMNLR
ncbi:transketolase [Fluviispira multicolorata]|uniref:Transketolase n=1 Tax=Fluviispira multicolorata TaxID=2654512 RepID=A0A833JEW9_9BACT|nr:transketolase [Fluviispira multicolorata]KAB8033421.1 transketolase [Fluviispira multicolorata]